MHKHSLAKLSFQLNSHYWNTDYVQLIKKYLLIILAEESKLQLYISDGEIRSDHCAG